MSAAHPATEEAPAIAALGFLFRVSEVYLWDDAVVTMPENSTRHVASAEECMNSCATSDVSSSLRHFEYYDTPMEDLELAQEMDALGLPISFNISKEKRNSGKRGRKKRTKLKSAPADKDIDGRVPGVSGVDDEEDLISSRVCHYGTYVPCYKTTEDQTAPSFHDLEAEPSYGIVCSDGDSRSVLNKSYLEPGKEQNYHKVSNLVMSRHLDKEIIVEGIGLVEAEIADKHGGLDAEKYPGYGLVIDSDLHQEGELPKNHEVDLSSITCHTYGTEDAVDVNTRQSSASSMDSSLSCATVCNQLQGYPDNFICGELGDWVIVWDAFYMKNYFYNSKAQESTWFPPPGLEQFTFACSPSDPVLFAGEAKEDADVGLACEGVQDQNAHTFRNITGSSHENGYSVTYKDRSPEAMSSRMNPSSGISETADNILAANRIPENLDIYSAGKEISDEQTLADELDFSEYVDLQGDNITSCDGWNICDVSLDGQIKCDSSTKTLGEVGCKEKQTITLLETVKTSTTDDELDSHHKVVASKKKQRGRRLNSQFTSGVIEGVSATTLKYWCQRYLLFSRFDSGIMMDEEGWFSVTPELIARHQASRCGDGTIIDCFTGVGGNAIQFASRSNHVIAIDIDPRKIDYAQHNAAIYGVNDRIDFITGDFFQLAPCLKGDTVFLSPPWGGPDYAKVETYDITSMLKPRDGCSLFKTARTIASKVVMFLPRNVDLNQLAELSLSVNPPWTLEVEKNYLNGKFKAVTAYFSNETT